MSHIEDGKCRAALLLVSKHEKALFGCLAHILGLAGQRLDLCFIVRGLTCNAYDIYSSI